MTKRTESDSSAQWEVEAVLIKKFKEKKGIHDLKLNHDLSLKSNPKTKIRPDFYSEDRGIIGEVHSHLGKLKPAQMHKVASDVLKMLLLEEDYGKTFDKYYVICSKEEKAQLTGNSYVAQVMRNHDIKVLCFEIEETEVKALREAMEKQNLLNTSLPPV